MLSSISVAALSSGRKYTERQRSAASRHRRLLEKQSVPEFDELRTLNRAKLESLRAELDHVMETENQHRIESLIRQIESLEALVD